MVRRKGGSRAKSRHLLTKKDSGKFSLTRFFQEYTLGEKVLLIAEPAWQKSLFHHRFYGKRGIVAGIRGKCYEVTIKDGSSIKTIITHPVHLRKVPVQ